jgi:hypothetical protein
MGEPGQEKAEEKSNGPISTAFAVAIVLACVVGIVLLVKGLYPTDLPSAKNPDFIDNVFDNRAVVWAAPLLLVSAAAVLAFGGLFIVISTGIRMANGEWLRKAGPFEISETAVSEIEGQVDFLAADRSGRAGGSCRANGALRGVRRVDRALAQHARRWVELGKIPSDAL